MAAMDLVENTLEIEIIADMLLIGGRLIGMETQKAYRRDASRCR
jgi:hypothetical protein